ncbi:MAG TPA: bacteriohemerythrin [Verrucomicrobiae bacterium]|nr:bacteriohemerythrin [Verrucomicrobiae bacterium]
MNLKTKLLVLCGIPIAGLLVCATASYLLQVTSMQRITRVQNERMMIADVLRQMQLNTVQVQQWLTDISATRGQDGLNDGFTKAAESRDAFVANGEKMRQFLAARADSSGVEKMNALVASFDAYYQAGRSMAEAYVQHGTTAGNQKMSDFDNAAQRFLQELEPFIEQQSEESKRSLASVQLKGNRVTQAILLAALGLAAAMITLGIFFVRSITSPLNGIVEALSQGSELTGNAAQQVSSSSQTLAEGASQQAAALEETSASLEELASMTRRNAENAHHASELARATRSGADTCATDMQAMSSAMEAIKTSSDDISKIIRTIDEIAFQTNILALNAAVEAARAGEAGMGFAVVADEVRNLAQRSAQAARETSSKIEGAISRTGQGVAISGKVVTALSGIVSQIREVDELVAEVSSASKEQTQGISQINAAVGEMDKVTQRNAASAEESAGAADQLHAQARMMHDSVADLRKLLGQAVGQTSGNLRAEPSAQPRPAAQHRLPGMHHRSPSPPRNASVRSTDDLIRWEQDRMTTGVESIDEQHQELIKMINELHRACVAGAGKDELGRMMNFLAAYVQTHFAHEEELMSTHRCPTSAANKAAHLKFLQSFTRLKANFEEHGPTTSMLLDLQSLVGDWLATHICSIDTGLRKCPAAR